MNLIHTTQYHRQLKNEWQTINGFHHFGLPLLSVETVFSKSTTDKKTADLFVFATLNHWNVINFKCTFTKAAAAVAAEYPTLRLNLNWRHAHPLASSSSSSRPSYWLGNFQSRFQHQTEAASFALLALNTRIPSTLFALLCLHFFPLLFAAVWVCLAFCCANFAFPYALFSVSSVISPLLDMPNFVHSVRQTL